MHSLPEDMYETALNGKQVAAGEMSNPLAHKKDDEMLKFAEENVNNPDPKVQLRVGTILASNKNSPDPVTQKRIAAIVASKKTH